MEKDLNEHRELMQSQAARIRELQDELAALRAEAARDDGNKSVVLLTKERATFEQQAYESSKRVAELLEMNAKGTEIIRDFHIKNGELNGRLAVLEEIRGTVEQTVSTPRGEVQRFTKSV